MCKCPCPKGQWSPSNLAGKACATTVPTIVHKAPEHTRTHIGKHTTHTHAHTVGGSARRTSIIRGATQCNTFATQRNALRHSVTLQLTRCNTGKGIDNCAIAVGFWVGDAATITPDALKWDEPVQVGW